MDGWLNEWTDGWIAFADCLPLVAKDVIYSKVELALVPLRDSFIHLNVSFCFSFSIAASFRVKHRRVVSSQM